VNPVDVATFALIVTVATIVTMWFGPLWFILIVGFLCCVWVVVSADWRPL
jgi:hypothetical protein